MPGTQKSVVHLDAVVGIVVFTEIRRLLAIGIKTKSRQKLLSGEWRGKLGTGIYYSKSFLPFNGESHLPLGYEVPLSSPLPSNI